MNLQHSTRTKKCFHLQVQNVARRRVLHRRQDMLKIREYQLFLEK